MVTPSEYSGARFPKETTDGTIEIIDAKIICTGAQTIHSCEVNINDIEYAYIIINRNKESLLFLFDSHQNYLPTNYSGFSKVYQILSQKLQFDNQTFFENVHKKTQIKKEIWRKLHPANFTLHKNKEVDYHLGFEIQSPEKEFIHWDTTYEELKNNPNVHFDTSPYGQEISKFIYPIRIGNLILENLSSYFDCSRPDVPILHFYSHCIDATNSDKSYYAIKELFLRDFKPENRLSGYERKDQNSISFIANNMVISLLYTYDSEWHFDGGHTSFSVSNQREYPALLIDKEYESNMEISAILEFSDKLMASHDYKRNIRVKRRPAQLKSSKAVIWMDDKNDSIGFADHSYCQVFKMFEIRQFTIQNILPAKGPGGAYLELDFVDNAKSQTVLRGACNVFDKYKKQLREFTGLDIKMAPAYHDC